METLRKTIYELEKGLMTPEVRQSAQAIRIRLCEDFTEFCSSGKVYRYKQTDVFDNGLCDYVYEIEDFEISQLSENCVHATYIAVKRTEDEEVRSLRSSIWRSENDVWKMAFHQGTPIPTE